MALWIWIVIIVAAIVVLGALFAVLRAKQRKSSVLAVAGPGTGEQS